MRSFTLFAICLCLTLPASAQIEHGNGGWFGWLLSGDRIEGNGESIDQNRDVNDFNEVSSCCKIRVELSQGNDHDVRVEAESNLINLVVTEVSGDRLEIYFDDDANFKSKEPIIVYVTTPELRYVAGKAGADVEFMTAFEGDELELDASSGATVVADFSGQRLEAEASSGSFIQVSGRGDRVEADASSGASIEAVDFTARDGEAEASSGAAVEINVSGSLDADASSGGRVRYRGDATDIRMDTGSGGSVRKG